MSAAALRPRRAAERASVAYETGACETTCVTAPERGNDGGNRTGFASFPRRPERG